MASAELYNPLSPTKQEIRILLVVPGDRAESLRCELRTVSLLANPRYVALSYVWGDLKLRASISLNGQDVKITQSLEAAVRAIRHEFYYTPLWADAVCIYSYQTTIKDLSFLRGLILTHLAS